MTNPFHSVTANGKYAVDIVKINRLGKRAKSLFLKHLSQYYIFGNEARSLCKGIKVMLAICLQKTSMLLKWKILAIRMSLISTYRKIAWIESRLQLGLAKNFSQ